MAKVIENYVPDRFKRINKWAPREERGKVIPFSVPEKKST